MPDTFLSDIDIKNKMAWIWPTLKYPSWFPHNEIQPIHIFYE